MNGANKKPERWIILNTTRYNTSQHVKQTTALMNAAGAQTRQQDSYVIT